MKKSKRKDNKILKTIVEKWGKGNESFRAYIYDEPFSIWWANGRTEKSALKNLALQMYRDYKYLENKVKDNDLKRGRLK